MTLRLYACLFAMPAVDHVYIVPVTERVRAPREIGGMGGAINPAADTLTLRGIG